VKFWTVTDDGAALRFTETTFTIAALKMVALDIFLVFDERPKIEVLVRCDQASKKQAPEYGVAHPESKYAGISTAVTRTVATAVFIWLRNF
jgi:hypothetical protein